MTQLPDLSRLSHDEKDALILALWAQVQLLAARVAEREAKLGGPPKTPDGHWPRIRTKWSRQGRFGVRIAKRCSA